MRPGASVECVGINVSVDCLTTTHGRCDDLASEFAPRPGHYAVRCAYGTLRAQCEDLVSGGVVQDVAHAAENHVLAARVNVSAAVSARGS